MPSLLMATHATNQGTGKPTKMSNTFEPILLLTAISPLPALATAILDNRSGTLVPAANNVRPMTGSGIPTVSPNTVAIQTIKYAKMAIHTMHKVKVTGQNFLKIGRRQSGTVSHSSRDRGKEIPHRILEPMLSGISKGLKGSSSSSSSSSPSALSSSSSTEPEAGGAGAGPPSGPPSPCKSSLSSMWISAPAKAAGTQLVRAALSASCRENLLKSCISVCVDASACTLCRARYRRTTRKDLNTRKKRSILNERPADEKLPVVEEEEVADDGSLRTHSTMMRNTIIPSKAFIALDQ
mmetsp:Transcript_33160/g.65064  ORF Transcript_33160/g.65064 Transcript_33160/m.65064 type:complete len:295 (+) Transcript_33160:400-1284(+)